MQSGIESPDAGNRCLDADPAVWLGFVLILAGIEFSLLIKRRLRQAGAVQSSALIYVSQ